MVIAIATGNDPSVDVLPSFTYCINIRHEVIFHGYVNLPTPQVMVMSHISVLKMTT